VVTSETVVVETVDFAFSQVHDTVGFLSGKGFLVGKLGLGSFGGLVLIKCCDDGFFLFLFF